MRITVEEELMYRVMKAIYESGIPVSFKGSMVLKACLLEAGYLNETRHTVDIDANWNTDTPPSAEQMTESLQKALQKSGIELNVSLYRMYGEGRSAGFELADQSTGEIFFTMDVDVNRPMPPTKIYEVEGIRFRGVTSVQMIADKLSVISTTKVFRRIKDVVDLYYLSRVFPMNVKDVMEALNISRKKLGDFADFLHGTEALKHSYEKFRFEGGVSKPPFEEIYDAVKAYISDFLCENR